MDAMIDPGEPMDREAQLQAKGLAVWGLQQALLGGRRYLSSLTPHDTAIIRGVGTYNAISKGLADIYQPQGWRASDRSGFRRLIHPDGEIAVVVNSWYPIKEGSRKAIRAAVERNRLLLTPLQGHFADLDEDFGGGELTYFLLHRIDPVSYSIQAELSLPTSIDGTDLGGFHERITIPDPTEARDVTIDEGKEEDFKVKPKSG